MNQDRFYFRYWCTKDKYMHYLQWTEQEFHILEKGEFILMQSTGLTAKNNKLIYEGDILLFPDLLEDGNMPAAIVFKNGAFGIEITESISWLYQQFYSFDDFFNELGEEKECLNEVEIIGNVFENPEDLGEEQTDLIKKTYF